MVTRHEAAAAEAIAGGGSAELGESHGGWDCGCGESRDCADCGCACVM